MRPPEGPRRPGEAASGHPDDRPLRGPGDGWVACRCGAEHWGRFGAAGLLLTDPTQTRDTRVLLQHRALWSHHGGTWGVPGGALGPAESAVDGAVREAVEEAGVPPGAVRAWAASVLAHPDWSYTTIVGEAVHRVAPAATDPESLEIAWVPLDAVTDRPLLPAFADAWPDLRTLVRRRVLVVVDAANVVGSRPDGWWRDHAGAAEGLHAALAAALPVGVPAAALGLPADRWWPDVLLVLEGAAAAAPVDGPDSPEPGASPVLGVRRAAGSGDDAVVAAARAAGRAGGYSDVVVVTADRRLAGRVRDQGGTVAGPRAFRDALPWTSPGRAAPPA